MDAHRTSDAPHPLSGSKASTYSKQGYDFMETFRHLGPTSGLYRVKAAVTGIGFLYSFAACGAVWWLTTDFVKLTSDNTPVDWTVRQRAPNQVILRKNRFTGRVSVIEAQKPTSHGQTERYYRVPVNRLVYTYDVYNQKVHRSIGLPLDEEMKPFRFADQSADILATHSGRAISAEQQGKRKEQDSEFSSLMLKYTAGERRQTSSPLYSAAKVENDTCEGRRVVCDLTFRSHYSPHTATGNAGVIENAVESALRETVVDWYLDWIRRTKCKDMNPAIADHMIRKGVISGLGATAQEVLKLDQPLLSYKERLQASKQAPQTEEAVRSMKVWKKAFGLASSEEALSQRERKSFDDFEAEVFERLERKLEKKFIFVEGKVAVV